VLVQLQVGCFTRFRCHAGHAYSLSSLLADVTQSLEHFLWSTLRTMEESILLLRRLAQHARDRQATQVAEVAERKVGDAERSTQLIRDLLRQQEPLSEDRLCHDPG
jgi:two-component system chemotaxis response regulator CheB